MDNYKIDNHRLREAMFKVFGGKCFYTGRDVTEESMVIDHIVPKSKGGADSVFNYALTTKAVNSKKSAAIDKEGVAPILYLIKMSYAPKVLKLLAKAKTEIVGEVGIRVTIYVNPGEWETVKDSAWSARLSAGKYLMDLHKANMGGGKRVVISNLIEDPGTPELDGLVIDSASLREVKNDGSLGEDVIDSDDMDGWSIEKPDPVQKAADDLKDLTQGNITFRPDPKNKDKTDKKKGKQCH